MYPIIRIKVQIMKRKPMTYSQINHEAGPRTDEFLSLLRTKFPSTNSLQLSHRFLN